MAQVRITSLGAPVSPALSVFVRPSPLECIHCLLHVWARLFQVLQQDAIAQGSFHYLSEFREVLILSAELLVLCEHFMYACVSFHFLALPRCLRSVFVQFVTFYVISFSSFDVWCSVKSHAPFARSGRSWFDFRFSLFSFSPIFSKLFFTVLFSQFPEGLCIVLLYGHILLGSSHVVIVAAL